MYIHIIPKYMAFYPACQMALRVVGKYFQGLCRKEICSRLLIVIEGMFA